MDEGKQLLQQDKRLERSKEVKIVITLTSNLGDSFNVVDAEGNLKYDGFLSRKCPTEFDRCSCPSFTNNNNDAFMATHAEAFQCKHIIAAREQKKDSYPKDFDQKLVQKDLVL